MSNKVLKSKGEMEMELWIKTFLSTKSLRQAKWSTDGFREYFDDKNSKRSKVSMTIKKRYIQLFFFTLSLILTAIYTKIQIKEYSLKDKVVCGTVLRVKPPTGHQSSYSVLVDWDDYGVSVINGGSLFVQPVGSKYCYKPSYFPFLGRAGLAYGPSQFFMSTPSFIFCTIWVVLLSLFGIVYFLKKIQIEE